MVPKVREPSPNQGFLSPPPRIKDESIFRKRKIFLVFLDPLAVSHISKMPLVIDISTFSQSRNHSANAISHNSCSQGAKEDFLARIMR